MDATDTEAVAPHNRGGAVPLDEAYAPYNPHETEIRWYEFWEEHGLFRPEASIGGPDAPPFVVTMPPPNVTGGLHNGHTLFVTLEDVMVRWHRMLGDRTLWVPGRDHAGIAGQLVVERDLKQRTNLMRHDLGREKFVDQVWEWMHTYGRHIQKQLRRLGASADWSRDMFTMDEHHVRAVRTAFTRLYEKGLIYRGHRIANWCADCATVLSDLEVEYREVPGTLTYFRYPIVDDAGDLTGESIPVATTRPETILGDVGVAVHPTDERYVGLVGKTVLVPHVKRRGVIVADEAVDPEFGTGAVKLTPAHDPTDYEIALRHGLPMVNVMTLDGKMNGEAGDYVGLTTLEARRCMVQELEETGLLERVEEYIHSVGHCQRSGTVLEPLLLDQWYLRIQPLADPALTAVRDGRIRIIPERFGKVYFNWMENIRDWCISRQLWWGHRIPVYYCDAPGCGEQWASVDEPQTCPACGGTAFHQDPDVLDTWFSSGLWPFSTLGWPDETDDLKRYYPTSVMETGYDILFFWVARMIMFGLEFTGKEPFHTVYLHGLVKAATGQKMSKTKGNVQDPLELIETYGTDALRLAVTIGNTPGNDFTLTPGNLESRRDFVNKLWNVGRFVQANTTTENRARALEPATVRADAPVVERWIAGRLGDVTEDVTRLLGELNFGEAGRVIHDFIWDELADWYLEAYKVQARSGQANAVLLAQTFEKVLRLLHPFAPFVTEDLWHRLLANASERPVALIVTPWPERAQPRDVQAEEQWNSLMEVVRAIRVVRSDYRIEAGRWVPARVVSNVPERRAFWEEHARLAGALPGVRVEPALVAADEGEDAAQALGVVAGGVQVLIPALGLFDVEKEVQRAEAEEADARTQVQRLEGNLARPGFVDHAPEAVVQGERQRLAEQRERLAALKRRRETLARLGGG